MNGVNLRAVLNGLGGALLFLLLNIETADAFTPEGSRSIAFEFRGNFGRDMTCSIAWGPVGLALLAIGFAMRTPATRYVGIGLLAASFLHQRFLDRIDSADSP